MQPTAPHSGTGGPPSPRCISSSSSSSSSTTWGPVPSLALHTFSSTTPISSSPRHDLSSIDGGTLLLLLHQLHRRPERGPNAEGGPPGAPRGAPSSPDEEGASEGPSVRLSSSSNSNSNSSSSSSSSSRDMLLQLLADEIMPQFFAHTSIQNLLSLLQQHQHNPERLSQALEEEIYTWGRQEGPPLSTPGGPPPPKGPSGLVRGWRLSPRPLLGLIDGSPLRVVGQGAPQGPLESLLRGGPLEGPPRGLRINSDWSPSPSPRRPRGPCASKEGPPALPASSQLIDTPQDEFVTPVGAPEEVEEGPLEGGPQPSLNRGEAMGYPGLLRGPTEETDAAEGPPSLGLASDEGPLGDGSRRSVAETETNALEKALGGPQGAPTRGLDEANPVLASVRRAREERSLRAPLSLDEETEGSIAAAFDDEEGMGLEAFRDKVVGPLLGLGPFLAGPLFKRIDSDGSGVLTPEKLKSFWRGRLILKTRDPSLNGGVAMPPLPTYGGGPLAETLEVEEDQGAPLGASLGAPVLTRGSLINFMGALATRGPSIYPEDLKPWVLEVAHCAPDMAFLLDPQSEEYLEKYVDSVVARIMFYVDEDSKGWLSMRDLRRSPLVHVWCSLNPSVELSVIRKFFSYDHFYVLYCAFHELDEDDDFLLHRSDVCKYQGHSMSTLVEGRLFSQAAHSFSCEKPQHLNFDDWIWFVLAYHEVTLPKALRFWFEVFDIDGDGFLRDHELEAAFESQAERLRMREGKAQSYKEFVCQVSDALGLPTRAGISCRDLLESPFAAGFLVNCLLKAHVLRAFDEGELIHNLVLGSPIERAVFGGFSPFEIYAHTEYAAFTAQRYEEEIIAGEGVVDATPDSAAGATEETDE